MTQLTRRGALAAGALAGLAPLARPALAQAGYPARPVQLIVPWAAGGGTDATARIIAAILEKELGQPVNVVNRTGGSGVVGHTAIAKATPDGYTIGILTVEICMMHWQGLTDVTRKSYTPLALVNEDPSGIQVSASSPYRDLKGLAEAIKASKPGQLKASGTGQGGIWHLALAGWLGAMGLPANQVRWVPSNGAAPGMQDLAAGGVDIVTCSLPEARAIIEAGRARSLGIMAQQRHPLFADVPTLKEALGIDYSIGAWRGIAGPLNMPAEVTKALSAALQKTYNSQEYKDFMNARGLGMVWADSAGFGAYMESSDAKLGAAMREAGLARS